MAPPQAQTIDVCERPENREGTIAGTFLQEVAMRKGLMIGLLALFAFGFATTAFAGLPCAAYSSTVMDFQRVSGTGLPCVTCGE